VLTSPSHGSDEIQPLSPCSLSRSRGLFILQTASALAMYPDELELMDEALTGLTGAITTGAACTLDSKHIKTVISVLDRWPTSQRFPGSLHLRLLYLSPQGVC
jgi:phospholipase A-2-activating protein